MKYSVLMSVYENDDPVYLKRALNSIYEDQTRKPDEIIIVFDGPLPFVLHSVLKQFQEGKESIVHFYQQPENKGLGEALRIGTAYCTGDYIFRMDADDISVPTRFEKMTNYMESNLDIDVLGTDIIEFNYDPDREISNGTVRTRACPSSHDDIIAMAKTRNPMNHVTVCIKREALLKCGGYETLLLLEDYYLWLKMIVSGCRFANINEPLVLVRIGNGFYGKRSSKVRIKGWKYLQKYMIQNNLIGRRKALLNMILIRGFVYCPGWVRKISYNKFLRTSP